MDSSVYIDYVIEEIKKHDITLKAFDTLPKRHNLTNLPVSASHHGDLAINRDPELAALAGKHAGDNGGQSIDGITLHSAHGGD